MKKAQYMENSCVIVVPIHKHQLDEYEKQSLHQLQSLVHDKHIVIMHPSNINKDAYMPYIEHSNVICKSIDAKWLSSA